MSQNFVWRCVQFNTSLHTHMYTQKFNIPASILKFVFDIHVHCTSALVAKLAWIQVKVWSRPQNLITKLYPAIPFQSIPVQSSPFHHSIPPFQSTESQYAWFSRGGSHIIVRISHACTSVWLAMHALTCN